MVELFISHNVHKWRRTFHCEGFCFKVKQILLLNDTNLDKMKLTSSAMKKGLMKIFLFKMSIQIC